MDPDGSHAQVVEVLAQSCPLHIDGVWKEGNLPTGNQTTRRTGLPSIGFRAINAGIQQSKSVTAQVVDTCCLIEGNSEIDKQVLKIEKDPKQFRWSEDMAFVEKFNQTFSTAFVYGDVTQDPEKFNGLAARYNAISTTKGSFGYQIVSAGGSDTDMTSAWLVAWGDKSIHCIYPSGSQAGLEINDMGQQRVTDASGYPYYAWCTNFVWTPGLAVKDPRYVARVANIDTSALATYNSGSDTSPKLIDLMTRAKNKIQDFASVKPVWYVNETVYTWLEVMLMNKSNLQLTMKEMLNGMPVLYFAGIPIRKVDAILNTETAIS
jgi:hypothetical protein